MSNRQAEILGIGGPFVDHVIAVPEKFLDQIAGEKGGMVAVDFQELVRILERSGTKPDMIPGGSAANTLRGLAQLGHLCAMTGKIGPGDTGDFFLQSFHDLGISAHFVRSPTPTAQVACLVTPDGQRTMRTYLGAACEMREDDLEQHLFAGPGLVFIEGYTLPSGRLTHRAMQLAKTSGAKVALSLSSFEIVEHFKEVIHTLLEEHVDIVFANEDEGHALHGMEPVQCCKKLSEACEIAVVSVGKEGCYVGHNGMVVHCPALDVRAIDSIGAGDLFSSGFLHGFLEGHDPEVCGHLGCVAGGAIVQVPGAILPDTHWEDVLEKMRLIKERLKS